MVELVLLSFGHCPARSHRGSALEAKTVLEAKTIRIATSTTSLLTGPCLLRDGPSRPALASSFCHKKLGVGGWLEISRAAIPEALPFESCLPQPASPSPSPVKVA